MKQILSECLKGMGIGIANIIPGFSGGTMAIIFGVYEKIIYAFSHFFEQPLTIIKDMWAILLGVFLGVILAVTGIALLLETYPIPTILFFIGLIFGSIPNIQVRASLRKENKSPKIALLVGTFLLIGLSILPISQNSIANQSLFFFFGLFFIGALGSASMVVPGISGSLIFLVFGYYDYILGLASDFLKAILQIDGRTLLSLILPVIILGVGIILGLVLIAKLIEELMLKQKETVYGFITGLLIASPIAILVNMQKEYPNVLKEETLTTWFLGFLFVLIGTLLSYKLSKSDPTITVEELDNN